MIAGPIEIKPVTATAAGGASLSALLAGKVIEARLTLALADGLFRFTTPEGDIDLALPRNLPPGTKVSIASQPGGALEVTVLTEEGVPAPSVRPAQPAAPTPPFLRSTSWCAHAGPCHRCRRASRSRPKSSPIPAKARFGSRSARRKSICLWRGRFRRARTSG